MESEKFILVDWHGPADYNRRFEEKLGSGRSALDFYFYYDRRTGVSRRPGRNTCLAACAHCFLRVEGAEEQFITLADALEVAHDLKNRGYANVDLVPSDSLGDEVLASGKGGSAYRVVGAEGMAWSSGAPLALEGWEQRLELAYQAGYRSVVMNGHDIAGTGAPIDGVTRASTLKKALEHLKKWNEKYPDKQFTWGFTFTLRSDTCTYEAMAKIAAWAASEAVQVLRFNCFANFRRIPKHDQYLPSRENIVAMYAALARLHQEYLAHPMMLSVSEDFGDAGVGVIEQFMPPKLRGQRVGVCRAGWGLFAITPINGTLTVVGCVDKLAPYLGRVVRCASGTWDIEWDFERVEELRAARADGRLYGCFGGVGRNRPADAGFNDPPADAMLANNTKWGGYRGTFPVIK